MKKNYLFLIVLSLSLLQTVNSFATHIMGGGLTYEYLGYSAVTGKYQYKVTAKIYRYCEAGSANLLNKIVLGVYNEDPANPNATTKTKYGQFNIPRINLVYIVPPDPNDSCAFVPNVCVQEGTYEGIINVDSTGGGYHFIADDCCRNGNILNINNPTGVGFAFYAFVPPTAIVNNSPVYAVAPVPFLCTSDTTSILNSAIDPDGDLLVYNFVRPLKGVSPPTPNPTPTLYPWPIPKANYAAGYSLAQPFGPSGYSYIDTLTGLTSFYAPFQGFYVVEVEIREYRAGQLISVTRRGLQLIFIPCPPNIPPAINNNIVTSYTINEGDTLCFPIGFHDANGDSLFLSYTGDLFDSTIVNPPATLTFANNKDSVNALFCWNTNCTTGRATPYQFFITMVDNGCPAKTDNVAFTVDVIPFTGTQLIYGPDTLCYESLINHLFYANGSAGSTYNWSVTNGTITSGNGTDSIYVDFNSTGPYSVSMAEINARGCAGDTATKNIFIENIFANAGNDIVACSNDTLQLGSASVADYSYQWSPSTGLSSSTVANPILIITNNDTVAVTVIYVVTVTNVAGCTRQDSVSITINPLPVANAGADALLCSGDNYILGTNSIAGYTYNWTPALYLNNSTDAQPVLNANNISGVYDTLNYYLTISLNNCIARDSVQIIVKPAPIADAGSDVNLCVGDTVQLGNSTIQGYTYQWSPPTGLNSTTIANPLVIIPDTGSSVSTYTYYLVTQLNGCFSYDSVSISVNALPDVIASANTTGVCIGSSVLLSASGGITYQWAELSNPGLILSTTDTFTVAPLVSTSYIVIGTTSQNCFGTDTITLIVNALPGVSINASADSVCVNDTVTLSASGAVSYEWQNANQPGIIIATGNPITQSLTSTTTFIVTGTDGNGCSNSDTITVNTKQLPVAFAGNDQLICAFDTIYLGGTSVSGSQYNWTPSTGLNSATIANPYLLITDTTQATYVYILSVNNDGCLNTDTVEVTVNAAPAINVLPVDPKICLGEQVNLSAFGALNYLWYDITNPGTVLSNSNTLTSTPLVNTVYIVRGEESNGCFNYDTITVTVNPIPAVSSTVLPLLACAGDTVTILATGALTYQWELNSNPGVIVWTDSLLSGTFTTTTTYIITGTDLNGCSATSIAIVDITPLPSAFAGSDINICAGDTIQLGGVAQTGYTYNWSPATGLSSTTSSDPLAIIPDTTIAITYSYFLTVSANGCNATDTVNITTNTAPNINITGTDTICAGNSVTLHATGAISYSWVNAANPSTVLSTADSIVFSGNTSITYIVTGTTSLNCEAIDSFTVNVAPMPALTVTASSDTICKGDTVTLSASGATYYSWENLAAPGTIISNNNSINIFLNNSSTFIVTGSNDQGCLSIDTITITTIYPPAPPIVTGPLVICPGATPFAYVAQTALTGLNYNWSVTNGVVLNGQGTDSVNVTWNLTGPYAISVFVTNTFGCFSNNAGLLVTAGSQSALPAPTGLQNVCGNAIENYSAAFNPNFIYNWQVTGGAITSGNGTNTVTVNWSAFPPTLGQLWYSITTLNPDTFCYDISDTILVNVAAGPQTSAITGPAAICIDAIANLSVIATSGSTYNWVVSNGTINSGNGTSQINASFIANGVQSVTVIEVNSSGCIGSPITFNVTVNALPNANAGIDASICAGQNAQLNATGGTVFNWSPAVGLSSSSISNPLAAPATTTTYTVLVSDANNCSATDSVTVSVLPKAIATLNASVTSFCIGGQTQLQAAGGSAFAWTPSTGLSSNSIANPIANPNQTTTYTVIVGGAGLCDDTAAITITVNPLPQITVTGNAVICDGDSVQMSASGAATYSWTPSTGLNNSTISNPMASPAVLTTYTVTGTDANGCIADNFITINVNQIPVASFDTSLAKINCEGRVYDFVNSSTNATSYVWNFGDGTTSTAQDPQHAFNFGASYNVILTAANGPCNDKDTMAVTPGALSDYFESIPNVFTPNGDGKNDCFKITSKADFTLCTTVEIFNRWGNSVYKSSDSAACWDGGNAPDGTYFYVININDQKFNGSIMLVRN